jgi:hypothetical protein
MKNQETKMLYLISEEYLISLIERLDKISSDLNDLNSNKKEREWFTLAEFGELTGGGKSNYRINKMIKIAKEKNDFFNHKILAGRIHIHKDEVQRFFDGFYDTKKYKRCLSDIIPKQL